MRIPVFLLFTLIAIHVRGADVTIAWDPNSEPDLAGYSLHWGPSTRNYTNAVNTTNTSATLNNLPPGNYYIAARARTTNGIESAFSDELFFSVPERPRRLRVSVNIQSALKLGDEWEDGPQVVTFEMDATQQRFYRASIAARLE